MTRSTHLGAATVLAGVLALVSAAPAGAVDPPWPEYACPEHHVPPDAFTDTEGNTHALAIDCLRWYGIVNGVTQERYDPQEEVRRDQLASLLVRTLEALRIALPPSRAEFDDIAENTHQDAIERLAAADVLAGASPGRFDPASPVTRGQMASALWLTYTYVATGGSSALPARSVDFFDDDDGSIHEGSIDHGFAQGLLVGKQRPSLDYSGSEPTWVGGVYAPQELLRRDQIATGLVRLLARGLRLAVGTGPHPYLRGTRVDLRDGWTLELTGSDHDATTEVLLHDPTNPLPPVNHRDVIMRVRATRTGTDAAAFRARQRLRGHPPEFGGAGMSGSVPDLGVHSAAGNPCGRVPEPLPEVEVPPGGTVEGNLCFVVHEGYPSLNLYDAGWGLPSAPYLSPFDADGTEASPHTSPGS